MRCWHQGPSLVVHTPAKLNLFLEVLGKRPDGYHELETVMVAVGLYDTLRFTPEPSGHVRLTCRDHGLRNPAAPDVAAVCPTGADNLVCRAAEMLRTQTGSTAGARIELIKRIPIASGLGGGSSDAAATLVGLNQLWKLGLSPVELHGLAARLGSDVNFFLDSAAAAVCRGRGEQIAPLPLAGQLWFVIVRPRGGLSTGPVFRAWRSNGPPRSAADVVQALRRGRVADVGRHLFNGLRAPAEQLSGEIRGVLARLAREPVAGWEMSGSGTACFALCRTRPQAVALAGRLRGQGLGRMYVVESCV